MQLITKHLAFSFIAYLILVTPLVAEEANHGRLADGRAYRVDPQGLQLVDDVAELELTVEELKRQLEAARNEALDKSRELERVRSTSAPIQLSELRCPPEPHLMPLESDRIELQKKDAEIALLKSEIEQVRIQSDKALTQVQKDREQIDLVAASHQKEISTLNAKLKVADEQIALYKNLNESAHTQSARASVALGQNRTQSVAYTAGQTTSQDEQRARQAAANSFKKEMKADFIQVRELIQQRDALFGQFSGAEKSLQIRPTLASSSQNRTIDQLQKDVEAETSLRMLGAMSRELKEIKAKISEDIELVKRVGKL